MAHHWSNQFENQMSPEDFKNLFSKNENDPGATGKFPDGKIDAMDEGEIRMRIGTVEGRIVIEFGKSITSIGFTKEEALGLGSNIIEIAFKAMKEIIISLLIAIPLTGLVLYGLYKLWMWCIEQWSK